MKVCFFGSYETGELTEILKELFQSKGVEVIECQEDVRSLSQLIKSYPKLFLKHIKKKYDFMIIPWRGIMTFPLAKLVKKGPIIYFPFVPIYDSLVNDRAKFKRNSIQAKFIRFLEKLTLKSSDIIVLDNFETIEYFCLEYGLDRKKFRRLISAANENKFKPLAIKKRSEIFNVFFFGTFIPYHGVEIIVEAARILSKYNGIKFTLCGDGQTKKENEVLSRKYNLKNIHFLGFVDFSVLKDCLENSDTCLGMFGSIERRTNATGNKIFQVLASQKPLITRDTPVMKEISLENNENCILIPPANPEELAKVILKLKNDPELSKKIATNGYKIFKKITKESREDFWTEITKNLKIFT